MAGCYIGLLRWHRVFHGRSLVLPDGTPVDHSVAAVRFHLVYVLQTEIDRLKRQIAEKEAAVKAGQASLPAVTKVSASSRMFFSVVDGLVCAPMMQLQVCNHSASVQGSISLMRADFACSSVMFCALPHDPIRCIQDPQPDCAVFSVPKL